jgi:heme exporter protein A
MSSSDPPAIRVDDLSKSYGQFLAVDSVSLTVEPGETVGLFGPNGAGKSTLLRTIAGLIRPTSGDVFFDGDPFRADDSSAYRRIGVVTHDSMLYDEMTARENLDFHARLHGLADPNRRCERVLEMVGLTHRGSHFPDEFSHGLRNRLSLARALLHDPDVLLLDEPYSGLDQRAVADLEAVFDELDDRTVVLTTHDLDRGLDRCSRALVLDRGTLEADMPTAPLSNTEFEASYRRAIGLTPRTDDR